MFGEREGQNVLKGKCAVYARLPMDHPAHLLGTTQTNMAEAVARMMEEARLFKK